MQTLVRTPDRHEPMVTSGPPFKPSNRTCLQVAELQEPANAPGRKYCGEIRNRHKLCTTFAKHMLGLSDRCLRPYHVESTSSRLITEVKQHRVVLVLGWVTAWEYTML